MASKPNREFTVLKNLLNPVQPRHSNVLSSPHQHGKASGLVDGSFQYWLGAGASGQNVTPAPATPQKYWDWGNDKDNNNKKLNDSH